MIKKRLFAVLLALIMVLSCIPRAARLEAATAAKSVYWAPMSMNLMKAASLERPSVPAVPT